MDPGAIRCKGDIFEYEFWALDLAIHTDAGARRGSLSLSKRRLEGTLRLSVTHLGNACARAVADSR